MVEEIRRLWAHARWADGRLLDALRESGGEPAAAMREFGHVVGAAEVWLARLEQRPARLEIWPELSPAEAGPAVDQVHAGYTAFLAELQAARLEWLIRYTNSAGQTFQNSVADILLHAALHGQYHRGKVNLLLRQSGRAPAPADYIGFIRGVPAATSRPR